MAEIAELVDALVRTAQEKGAFYFTQTLLRVGGIEGEDPFELFRRDLETSASPGSTARMTYCRWARHDDFLRFLWNLLQCSEERPFNANPLYTTNGGFSLAEHSRITHVKVNALIDRARDAGRNALADSLAAAYPSEVLESCSEGAADQTSVEVALSKVAALNSALLFASDRERRAFGTTNQLVRWPRFEVLELLANEMVGLYGYRVYFSNGGHAEFSRTPERADALNVFIERNGAVNYFVGSLDDLRREWRVGSQRLFEIGLPGRYNEPGKWKPIVYEGPSEDFVEEISALSDDYDVQGALFYIYCTGHWVIEFAVRATVDLPVKNVVRFGPSEHPLQIWKIPIGEHHSRNERLYDGWVTLPAPTVEAVAQALAHIRLGMGRLAFVFDSELRWCLKYSMVSDVRGLARPEEHDLSKFDEVLVNPVEPALDLAMSWINAGRNASDPLTSYLCFFNSIETVVEAVWEDDLQLRAGKLPKQTKSDRIAERRACMEAAHRKYFPDDPNAFAREVYFTCFKQLAKRRRDVAEQIWGPSHVAVQDLFERDNDEPSLVEIRDAVAHGQLSLLHTDDVKMIRRRLTRLAEIAKAMVLGVLLNKGPTDPIGLWSGRYSIGMNMTDPRSTKVANTLEGFPSTDWTIRSEWIV